MASLGVRPHEAGHRVRAGRPSKKTPGVIALVVAALETGASRTGAAASAGISLDTLSHWTREDEELQARLTIAESRAECDMSSALFKAGQTDWRAAESWLKRRRPQDWGDKQTSEITGKDGGHVLFIESLIRVYGEESDTEERGHPGVEGARSGRGG